MVRALLAAVVAALCLAAPAHAGVPADWVGMMVDGPMLTPKVDVPAELDTMRGAEVGSVRFSIYWSHVQPFRTLEEIPEDQRDGWEMVDGVPSDFRALDLFVAGTSQRGFSLLPVVLGAPEWARTDPAVLFSSPTPKGRHAYAVFLTTLVHRYGPGGTFWADHPELKVRPIRRWQIWNEPNGPKFWAEQPGIPAYVELLKEAAPAIRAADPGAQVVLAGLFGRAWEPLAQLYGLGGGGLFDAVAVNPFTDKVKNLLLIVRRVRKKMRDNGDGDMPLIATEVSYPSAKGKVSQPYGFEVTEKGQAQRVRQALEALAGHRKEFHITGAFWSTWLSYDRSKDSSFDYAGLRHVRKGKVVAKPAYFAFRQTVRDLLG